MKRTPAPVSTASAASIIWSGVGEVKIWPGQAASSMPRPTKPACSGSCPEPPPEISATLPGFNARRRTNLCSAPRATMSACAAAKPSRLSVSRSSTALMSFFMSVSLESLIFFGETCQTAGEIGDGLIQKAVAPRAAQIGERQRELARARGFLDEVVTAGVSFRVRGEKIAPVGRGEVTDLE